MAEDVVSAHDHRWAYAACVPEVDVAAADAGGFDADVDFAGGEVRAVVCFLCCWLCLADP